MFFVYDPRRNCAARRPIATMTSSHVIEVDGLYEAGSMIYPGAGRQGMRCVYHTSGCGQTNRCGGQTLTAFDRQQQPHSPPTHRCTQQGGQVMGEELSKVAYTDDSDTGLYESRDTKTTPSHFQHNDVLPLYNYQRAGIA